MILSWQRYSCAVKEPNSGEFGIHMKMSCYIASSLKTNLSQLTEVLARKNVSVFGVEDTEVEEPISIRKAIRNVDFVIGILSYSEFNANVIYEIGIAHGLNKRVLLFDTQQDLVLPFDLNQHYIVKTDLENIEALEFAIDQVLNAPQKTRKNRRQSKPSVTTKPLGERTDRFLSRLNSLSNIDSGRDLDIFVSDLLLECGVEVVRESNNKDVAVDFAVWLDELEPIISNPLVIELKQNIRSQREIAEASNQLTEYLDSGPGSWGLILYKEGIESNHQSWNRLPRNIINIRLDDFVKQLSKDSFTNIVRHRRNILVHGVRA